jgi:hypothetical protein
MTHVKNSAKDPAPATANPTGALWTRDELPHEDLLKFRNFRIICTALPCVIPLKCNVLFLLKVTFKKEMWSEAVPRQRHETLSKK